MKLPEFCAECGKSLEVVEKPCGLGRMHRVRRCPSWAVAREHYWHVEDEWVIPAKFDQFTGKPLTDDWDPRRDAGNRPSSHPDFGTDGPRWLRRLLG